MDGSNVASDQIIAELIDMGFEFSKVIEAMEAVGPCLNDAVEFLLSGSCDKNVGQNERRSAALNCSTSQSSSLDKGIMPLHSSHRMKQSRLRDHLPSFDKKRKNITLGASGPLSSAVKRSKYRDFDRHTISDIHKDPKPKLASQSLQQDVNTDAHPIKSKMSLQAGGTFHSQDSSQFSSPLVVELESDWERKVGIVLQNHFRFSSLKGFQKEALEAWLAHRDCLVLAATGSGKSLCFQIPALLTRKVVVVISPLISLMHDQCMKLAKHGISACFLGSGQPDRSIESKAMSGMYRIVYVCPETLLRLMEPLKKLAENPGIALFAIDEVHCVSKWGHDFRPDYRRLSVLRENFSASNLNFLEFDIPLMALTATATIPVREDIINSLHMSKETKIVLTTFFRPNLRFSVKHTRTTESSYEKDFHELIETYTTTKGSNYFLEERDDEPDVSSTSSDDGLSDEEETSVSGLKDHEDDHIYSNVDDSSLASDYSTSVGKENQLTVEFLEDEVDFHYAVNDLDVSCGEFPEISLVGNSELSGASEVSDLQGSLERGPTIIYVPTRKETVKLAQYLCWSGVRAAAYHAKMPKTHLRRVHEEFHHNSLEVVVATIAFGMGIDKSNVRRIIHYGWPQSLETYYQEAGRAGRDGKLSDCILYANLTRIPTLLPNQRSEEQTRQAYKMLSDCFRYGVNTATCRAKTLVKYFGEEFIYDKCNLCDICVTGPPEMQNLKEEADVFMRTLKAECGCTKSRTISCCSTGTIYGGAGRKRLLERPNFKMIVSRIREQFQKFATSDRLWWQGLARILENLGYIKEGDDSPRVSIRHPELTDLGLRFLQSGAEENLYAYPEADMLLSAQKSKPYSSFSEWGRGWADPEIRRQRLQGRKGRTRKRKRQPRMHQQDLRTVRGRLAAKLWKH